MKWEELSSMLLLEEKMIAVSKQKARNLSTEEGKNALELHVGAICSPIKIESLSWNTKI